MNKIIPISMVTILVLSGFGVMAVSDSGMTSAKFGSDNLPPDEPKIRGPTNVRPGTYVYTFSASDPDGDYVFYQIDWGDNTFADWFGPYKSGEEISRSHTFSVKGYYTIHARAKDTHNATGPWGMTPVRISHEKVMSNLLILWFLEQFPNAFPIIRYFLMR
jgi:hypothetical protein